MDAGDGNTERVVDGRGVERRRRGPLNRWRRRTHHPLAACLRLLKGELYPERNRYRDVLILILVGVTAWAVVTAHGATATAHKALSQVQEGRSTSIGVICAVQSAIGEAGKETIEGGGVLPPALDRFLQQHGYPPVSVRQAAAAQAARRYVGSIGAHIAKELRQRGRSTSLVRKLLRPDGTINCHELAALANVYVR